MTLKAYLWGMKISAVLSLIAWGMVVYYIDPEEAGIFGQVLFYLSLFLALTGVFALFFTAIRKKIIDQETAFFYLGTNFRQGLLIALLAVVVLIFQSFRILTWWDGLLLLAGIFLFELYFLLRSSRKN